MIIIVMYIKYIQRTPDRFRTFPSIRFHYIFIALVEFRIHI